jgi:hypothetical protein
MNKSDDIKELATALAKAQHEVENASKSSTNPHFKSKYADLAEILNTVRPVFSSHGIAIVQMPSFADGKASVETLLAHSSGQWISNTCSAPVTKQDAQSVGSAITYLRRYSLAAFAGVAQEDDDGHAAVQQPTRTQQQPAQQPAPRPPVGKAPCTENAFQQALNRILAGEAVLGRQVRDTFALTEDQIQRLIAAETQAMAGAA